MGVEKSKLRASRSVPLAKYSGDQIQKNEMGRSCSTNRGEERCIHDFGGETFRKKALGIPRRRWEHNIKMDLQEIGCGERLDCIGP